MGERIPVTDGLFAFRDDGSIRLVGGYSASSGHHHFPLSDTCPYSGARDVERTELSGEGRLWGWTAVTVPPPGYRGEVPYGFGVVELPEGLRVVSRLTEPDPDRLHRDQPMRLVPELLYVDDEGREVVTYAFAPASAAAPSPSAQSAQSAATSGGGA